MLRTNYELLKKWNNRENVVVNTRDGTVKWNRESSQPDVAITKTRWIFSLKFNLFFKFNQHELKMFLGQEILNLG